MLKLFLILFSFNINAECNFCVNSGKETLSFAQNFLDLTPTEQLKKIESEGIKVFILKSERENTVPFFQWKKVRVDQGKLTDISKIEGSLGKTLCKNEKEIAKSDYTIVLNSDAPLSTMLHEYLHVLQIKKDPSWCETSKRLWNTALPSPDDIKIVRNHEWDVRQVLWKLKDHKAFNIEDHIVIAEGMINESKMRKDFDPSAKKIIENEQVEKYLLKEIDAFKQFLLKR